MKFDTKDPITISLTSLLFITLFSYLMLYKIKPEFVTKLNKKEYFVIDYKKLISYSLLFGLSTSIITFLILYKPIYYHYINTSNTTSVPKPVSTAFKPLSISF